MSLWPFVTILVSLVLILLFRRIDKRTISFHKFKRYADKLSADFDRYLQQKKQELAGGVRELESALKNAAFHLAKIEAAEAALGSERVNLGNERNELLFIKSDLERLKGLKEEIDAEVSSIENHLPPLRKLSKRVRAVGLRIVENEKALAEAREALPEIESQVRDRTETALGELRSILQEETKDALSPVVDEYRQNLDLLRNAHREELDRMKKAADGVSDTVERKVAELSASISACAQRVSRLQERDVSQVGEKISDLDALLEKTSEKVAQLQGELLAGFRRDLEEGLKGYAASLEAAKDGARREMFDAIEKRAKDLSSFVAGLEGRVAGIAGEIERNAEKHARAFELEMKAGRTEAAGLKSKLLADISEEANRNLLLLKPIVSEVNEKLQLAKREFSSLTDAMKTRFDAHIQDVGERIQEFRMAVEGRKDAIFKELGARLEGAEAKLAAMDQKVEEKVRQVSEGVSAAFVGKLREYGETVASLDGRIGDLKNIANTGQKMIEERIESVFREYQPDIEDKIQSIRRSAEEAFSRERDRVIKKMEELVGDVEGELRRREGTMQGFLAQVERKIKESEERLAKEKDAVLKDVEDTRVEAREELLRELENLKGIFKEEKERVLGRYDKDLAGVSERIEGLAARSDGVRSMVDERVESMNRRLESFRAVMEEKIVAVGGALESVRSVIGERVDAAVREVEAGVRTAETSYLKTGDELAVKMRRELERLQAEVEGVQGTVEGLKGETVKETRDFLAQFRQGIDGSFEEHKAAFRDREKELQSLVDAALGGVRSEVASAQREAGEALKGFEEKTLSVQKKIEKRLQEIERRISDFEKDSQIIKKAVTYKDEVKEEIEKLSDHVMQLREDKKDILELRRVMDGLKRDEGDIAAKVRSLKGEKKLVFDIAKNAETAVGLIAVVEEKIKFIESQKETLEKIESELKTVGQRFEVLEGKAGHLASKEEDIEVSVETITKTKEFIANLEKRTEILKESFSEIKGAEEDIKKRIALIEEKTAGMKQNERLMDELLTRFKSMDALVLDIETRTKQLQSAREWLASTESRLTNAASNADRLALDLKALMDRQEALGGTLPSAVLPAGGRSPGRASEEREASREKGGALSRESESKVKTVLTLFDQKWTIPEICKVTKMSRGEVELILELNKR